MKKLRRLVEKQGRAAAEESAREFGDPHLDEKEDSLGNAVKEGEVNDTCCMIVL